MKMPNNRLESIKNTVGMFLHIFGTVGFLLIAATGYSVFTSEDGLNSSLLKQDNWYAYGISSTTARYASAIDSGLFIFVFAVLAIQALIQRASRYHHI